MRNFSWTILIVFILPLEQIWSQESINKVEEFLYSQVENDNLKSGDTDFLITSEHTSQISGVHHIYFSQSLFGLEIFGTNSSVHVNLGAEIVSHNIDFQKDLSNKNIADNNPQVSAKQVIFSVAEQLGYTITEDLIVLKKATGKSSEYLLSGGGISITPIPVKLKYLVLKSGDLELVWEFSIQEMSEKHWWNVRASARTGKILEKVDFVVNCSTGHHHSEEDTKRNNLLNVTNTSSKTNPIEGFGSGCSECYEVFRFPLESPLYGDRTIEMMPVNLDASPYGWHDTDGVVGPEYTVTQGNNAKAYDGGDNFGYQPDGGTSLNFTGYDFNPIYSETNPYEDAAITNLFYWINILHDLMYEFGFTEAAGNFQNTNYSGEGIGGDSVYGAAQNIPRACNGSFSVPPDGINPTMRIDLCNDKDGVFDNALIIHEYIHGVSIRLIGGAMDNNCLFNAEQMGEGWSDWYQIIITMQPGDLEGRPRGIATYFRGFGPSGGGLRTYPYSTDLEINPLTYDSIKTVGMPHGVGTVWASMLWELTWGLINKYGFDPNLNNFTGNINEDAGNVMAMAIVTEALKFTPCSPGFVDARDAIFLASRAMYGAELECEIWPAFAKRGLGIQAYQGNSGDVTDGFESYEIPPNTADFNILRNFLCEDAGILSNEIGGLPYGGTYSGPGVTDNGDGRSYTFDPTILGVGNYSVSYTVVGSECQEASTATDTVQIVSDIEPPNVTCPEDFWVTIPFGRTSYSLPFFAPVTSDNCTSSLTHRQEPPVNSELGLGRTMITVYVSDSSGNESSCSYYINVLINENNISGNDDQNIIFLLPNPTKGAVEMNSSEDIGRLTVTILDINSRLIGELLYRRFGYYNTFTLKDFAPGLYFVKIKTENISQIHKIVKK